MHLRSRRWNKKATLVALRLCVTAVTGAMLALYPPSGGLSGSLLTPWLLYVASTFAYLSLPSHVFGRRRFDITFVALELTLLGTLFAVYGGSDSWFFYPLFLLVVLLAALARKLGLALILGVAVSLGLVILLVERGTSEPGVIILQVTTFLITSGIVGFLTEELDREEATSAQFENALEVTTLLAQAIDAETVYLRLTEVIARMFRAERVAVVLVEPGGTTARVATAIDAERTVGNLEIDLNLYPEIRTAINERRSVVIDRPEKNRRMQEVADRLPERARGATILVTPIRQGDGVRGVVFLRLEQSDHQFTDQEIRFCRLMADIAGKALERADHFAQVSEAARRDPLTGLYNVRAFRKALGEEINRAERNGYSCSLLMIDIDFLKNINDTYGHQAGDQVLRNLAMILNDEVRQVDMVARYGGEEFAILLTETNGDGAVMVAERLRGRIEEMRHGLIREAVTVSIGVASYPDDASGVSELIRVADHALYASKTQGRNRTLRYDAGRDASQRTLKPLSSAKRDHDPEVTRCVREALSQFDDHRQIMRNTGAISSLVTLMQARDPSALERVHDTAILSRIFLSHLKLGSTECATIHLACLLRDVGKLGVSNDILLKWDALTREEKAAVREHPSLGASVIAPLRGLDGVVPLVKHHHERWDGAGYPDGLRGDAIPYGARIVGLIDALHAMLLMGPGASTKHGLEHARKELTRNAGTQFDPDLTDSLIAAIDTDLEAITSIAIGVGEPATETVREPA